MKYIYAIMKVGPPTDFYHLTQIIFLMRLCELSLVSLAFL